MEQHNCSKIRSLASKPFFDKLKLPVWIVSGRHHKAAAAIVPVETFHKLQALYGLELEELDMPHNEAMHILLKRATSARPEA